MTALPGGAADKAGGRYEALWTALRVADLLGGRASRICLEPVGEPGVGVEFTVDVDGVTWGEQAKSTAKHWTIHELDKEGLLAQVKAQLDQGHRYRLVTAAGSRPLNRLTDRARATQTYEQFREIELAAERRREEFDAVARAWESSNKETWRLLRDVYVSHRPLSSLEREATAAMRLLFADDPPQALAAIRDLCDAHLHQDLRSPAAWAWLDGRLTRRLVVGDTNVIRRLQETVARHQRRVASAESTLGLVARPDADELANKLRVDDQTVSILDGRAGVGKSAVVAEVVADLEAEGWFVAIVGMDGTHRATATSRQLGQAADLDESPAVLLSAVSDGAPALLVVEQLDAVSVYGGRMTDNFEAVRELVDEAARSKNIRILLVVRTVDLEGDPRLRDLVREDVERHTLGRLDRERVRQHLDDHGLDTPDDKTLELLRTPLHLSVFAHLSPTARAKPHRSLQELYERYTEEVRQSIETEVGSLDWTGIIAPLVEFMSEHERLVAPPAVVDHVDRRQLGALESAAVLIRDGSGLRFFHESYFDYLFARAFIAARRDVHQFLADSGQYLFRRAQTRQLLEFLAGTDSERFRATVVELLRSDQIRTHLKGVVVSVLRGHDATEADWLALEDLAWSGAPTAAKVRNLLSSPQWFDAADTAGRWRVWLADENVVDDAFRQLVLAARERGQRTAELVAPHVGSSEGWRQRLRALISWSINSDLVDLAVDLIERGLLDDARGPIAVNSDFWSIVYGLHKDDPAGAARLTGAYLRRGLARARADGSAEPFESGHLDRHSPSGSVIVEIATLAPAVYLEEVLPFVVEIATADTTQIDGRLPTGPWGLRTVGATHGVDDSVFRGCLRALQNLVEHDSDRLAEMLDSFRFVESDELRFLACLAYSAGVRAGGISVTDALDWLLADKRNLSFGWMGAPHQATRELLSVCANRGTGQERRRIEEAILQYESRSPKRPLPPREPFTLVWPSWRYGQFSLLSAIDEELLSSAARRRLGELRRRFGMKEPPPPEPIEAHFVGSPVPTRAAEHMTDDNWLRALRTHDTDDTDWTGPKPVGGARELASLLGQEAKKDPARFAALAMRFDDDIPPAAIANVLRAVGGQIPREALDNLCLHAHSMHGADLAHDIWWAVQQAGDASQEVVEVIAASSGHPDPTQELARTPAGSDGQPYYGGDLASAGLNCVRGGVAIAIAALLRTSDEHLDTLAPVVAELASDPILAVRVSAAEAVGALTLHDPDRALDIAESLFDTNDDVLDARSTEQLLRWAVIRAPERFAPVLRRAVTGVGPIATRSGRTWAVAQYHGALRDPVPDNIEELQPAARAGAAEMFAANAHDSTDHLTVLFSDPAPEVRERAARVWWNLDNPDLQILEKLTGAFISSPALEDDDMDGLVRVYARLPGRLPDTTLEVCKRVIHVAGSELGDIRTARSAGSRDLIALILRYYRQGDDDSRKRCLDLIDRLVELNAYDVDAALAEER